MLAAVYAIPQPTEPPPRVWVGTIRVYEAGETIIEVPVYNPGLHTLIVDNVTVYVGGAAYSYDLGVEAPPGYTLVSVSTSLPPPPEGRGYARVCVTYKSGSFCIYTGAESW